ncbi:MAG: stage II sporulation protein M [Candidatus Pacearchaeota archaeon]|jgi:stage II sporulation protein M
MKKIKNVKRRLLILFSLLGLIIMLFSSFYGNITGDKFVLLISLKIIGFATAYFFGLAYFINSERKNYSKSWKFLKSLKYFILLVIILFIGALIVGFLYQPDYIVDLVKKMVEELVENTKGFGFFDMLWFIFSNNCSVAFISIISGCFFGLFPLLTALSNGYVLGFISEKSIGASGILVLWKLFPHGIFELPAVIIAIALGVKFGTFAFSKTPALTFKNYFRESIRIFIFVIVPLLVIAAIIETGLIFFVK